jgi:signal transduction histidine kinase
MFARQRAPSRARAWALCLLLGLAIRVPDYVIGIEVSLSIFYLVPVLLATSWLGPTEGIIISVVTTVVRIVSDVLTVRPYPLPLHTWWNAAGGLLIFCFVVWVFTALLRLHRHLEAEVENRTTELLASIADRDRLQHELLGVGARERSAIGRELHDDLGQHLVATAMAAKVLARRLEPRPAEDAVAVVGWIEQAIAKSRKIARGLLLSHIEPSRFMEELEELATGSARGTIECRVIHQGSPVRATGEQCAQLFRIAQEALGNALRHARPRRVQITVASDEQALCLVVEDDGGGLPVSPTSAATGMGLRIMEHRARFIGASFSVVSTPAEGTKVICRLAQPAPVSR